METPKEKANDLVVKFIQFVPADETFEFLYAKKCALIAVDEILNSIKSAQFRVWHHEEMTSEFWNEVKTEIEKL